MGITNSCLTAKDTNVPSKALEVSDQSLQDEFAQIFENNKRWVRQMNRQQPGMFADLAKEQKPQLLYIGCADSRVPPSKILSLLPGQIFEHRNIANVVLSTDFDSQSVINYAVEHLHVKHIIVCGHYNCGGVAAAHSGHDYGFLNNWLAHIKDTQRLHKDAIESEPTQEKKLRKFVEFNAVENAINVMKNASVQKHYAEYGFPTVHATVYSIETGRLIDLGVNLIDKMREFGPIYGHAINAYKELREEKSVEA
jgi:carbonic anhydrase